MSIQIRSVEIVTTFGLVAGYFLFGVTLDTIHGIILLSYQKEVDLMNTIKVAITIPKNLVAAIDMLSKQSKLSRSRFITDVLQEKVLREKEKMIKDAYDRVFSDDDIQKEQLEITRWLDGYDVSEGQEW